MKLNEANNFFFETLLGQLAPSVQGRFCSHKDGASYVHMRAAELRPAHGRLPRVPGYYIAIGTHEATWGRRVHVQLEVPDITTHDGDYANRWIQQYCRSVDGVAPLPLTEPPYAQLELNRWGVQPGASNPNWRRYHRLVRDRIDWPALNAKAGLDLWQDTLTVLDDVLAKLNATTRP